MVRETQQSGEPRSTRRETEVTMTLRTLMLLALASVLCSFNLLLVGCSAPSDDDDDTTVVGDDDDSTPGNDECNVEATGFLPAVAIVAVKADDDTTDHLFGECELDESLTCSMQRVATDIRLAFQTDDDNVVSCPQEATLTAGQAPHRVTVPMGLGSETTQSYRINGPQGQNWGITQVRTSCTDGMVIVLTDVNGRYEVVGDQLLDIDDLGVTGSVNPDLSVYTLSSGVTMTRD